MDEKEFLEQIRAEKQKMINEIAKQIRELNKKLANGKISEEEYEQELRKILKDLMDWYFGCIETWNGYDIYYW